MSMPFEINLTPLVRMNLLNIYCNHNVTRYDAGRSAEPAVRLL
jgi:hypothetical protein